MENVIYTGRKVGILADSHALLEPTIAALEDMNRKGITEIYSLGDNIGVGPNPKEVMDILNQYGVISIAGNSEYYCTLGIEPFNYYFDRLKTASHLWTLSKLNEKQIGEMKLFPASIELLLGGKKIVLCHFANDVRFDYDDNSTWTYQREIKASRPGYKQFMYTNSLEQKRYMDEMISSYGINNPEMQGFIAAKNEPLFKGKKADFFDVLIQGHVHFKIYEKSNSTQFYSIRAVGMAYGSDDVDTASYVILKEKTLGGFDFEEILVKYDRKKMIDSIIKSDSPDHTIEKFTGMGR